MPSPPRPDTPPIPALDLRERLVTRSRDPEADLRARIEAALRLGELGDPRLERRSGPFGPYLLPPLVELVGGTYSVGQGAQSSDVARPRHMVPVPPFRMGIFPVTNAEWALFIAADGYEDERWWDTEAARAWRRGEGTAHGARERDRHWWRRLRADPRMFDELYARGLVPPRVHERWVEWLELTEEDFQATLEGYFPDGRKSEPATWLDSLFNNPSQPVVGICWYEARAYCRWLSAQTELAFRLPTEVEREAAARGKEGRRYAWGDTFDRWRCNVAETHIRHTTPVGVFPGGDTPDGIVDLTGNTMDWTSSLWGANRERPEFGYPYRPDDGREDADAPAEMLRVLRGGTWNSDQNVAQAAYRGRDLPSVRGNNCGLRLVVGRGG